MKKSDSEIEGFLFSDESSSLSEQEFEQIKNMIEQISKLILLREKLSSLEKLDKSVALPSGNWDPKKKQVFEIDNSHSSFMDSFELIMKADFDIIKKLRLYSQAFSGYQLATLSPAVHRPWIKEKLPLNYDDFLKMLVSSPDESLIKSMKILSHLPQEYRISFPVKFGEIGWIANNMIFNKDYYMYLERICLLYESGILPKLKELSEAKTVTILEIGSGFGGLAYLIKKIIPNSKIILIDIPESLVFSYIYLATLFSDNEHQLIESLEQSISHNAGFTYIPNFNIPNFNDVKIDLAINTLSFAEMETEQVLSYCSLIKKSLSGDGVLFEQNFNTSPNSPKNLFKIINQIFNTPIEIKSNIISVLEKGTPYIWKTS